MSERTRRKILTRAELVARREAAREAGRAVVQCHGCFDIVHPGHVRHLQHAARQGDVLLVTITADSGVGKGDGRPLFSQELRAENLAALDCVHWVYVNPEETAEGLLDLVRPDVFIKGREYESNRDPRFTAERETVERHGGRVVFSSGDIVFSSSALVQELETRGDEAHAKYRQVVEAHGLGAAGLGAVVDGFVGKRVCVVGEVIEDVYVVCDRPEVAGESPVMSLRPLEERRYDGGAAIIAKHLAAMGARPVLVTGMSRSSEAEAMRQRLAVDGVEVRWIEFEGAMLRKERYLVGAQKVMKLDRVRPLSLDTAQHDALGELVGEAARGCDAAILADFGHGLITAATLGGYCTALRGEVGVLAGDVSGKRSALLRMMGMDLICPTEVELRDAMGDYDASLNTVVWDFVARTGTRNTLVTIGADGLIAFDREDTGRGGGAVGGADGWGGRLTAEHVPAVSAYAVDALGCGDALLAAATLTLSAGGSRVEAALIGSVAAGVQAARLGNRVVTARDLREGVRRVCGATLTASAGGHGTRVVV